MAFVPASAFAGASVKPGRAVCRDARTVRMSAGGDGDLSRRQILLGALAAMVPAAALARSGEGPKFSFFGGESSSSPFTYASKEGSGKKLYEALNPGEVQELVKALKETRKRLERTESFINQPNWEDIRSAIRLQMDSTRRSQMKLNSSIKDDRAAKKARYAFEAFKKDLESLDYAAYTKDQAKARKARSSALKSLDNWSSSVDLD